MTFFGRGFDSPRLHFRGRSRGASSVIDPSASPVRTPSGSFPFGCILDSGLGSSLSLYWAGAFGASLHRCGWAGAFGTALRAASAGLVPFGTALRGRSIGWAGVFRHCATGGLEFVCLLGDEFAVHLFVANSVADHIFGKVIRKRFAQILAFSSSGFLEVC